MLSYKLQIKKAKVVKCCTMVLFVSMRTQLFKGEEVISSLIIMYWS